MNNRNRIIAAATAITLIAIAPLVMAQEKKTEPAKPAEQSEPYRPGGGYGPGYGMGPGMMGDGGDHHGMMGGRGGDGPGYGPGYGMGPGMMGGYGHGYGPGYGMGPGTMMGRGGYGMGPGMMAGCGMGMMGPGMMGGHGMGMMVPGMMGNGMGRMNAIWSLDLTDEQASRIDKIHDELHRQHRGLMPQLWEAQDRLRDLYMADNRDPAAVGKAYAQVSDLQRQMLEGQVQAEKQMEDVLTKAQREQLQRQYRRSQRFNRYR
jgi:Spy/CpxP family protein refolding chaperone